MCKKLSLLFIVSALFFGHHSVQAWMIVPFFNINIVKKSIGGDNVFNFHYNASDNMIVYESQDFEIQTENGAGSYEINAIAWADTSFTLTEGVLPGWQNTSISCVSDNPEVTTSPFPGGVSIHPAPFSSITCVFTNTKQNEKTPVLIVPGILGTEINKNSEKLWLDLARNFADIGDEFMDMLQFNKNLTPLDATLTLGDMVGKPSVFFDYSDGLLQEFENQGYAEGASATSTLFTFPYDWRYGASGVFSGGKTNVDALKQKIADILVQTGSGKVDVVAHSTGGLLVKKYIMDNPAGNYIGKAVFVGAPNLGAPKAVKTLLQGDNFGIPFLDDGEMKKIAENLPVAYDLLPSRSYFSRLGSFVRVISSNNFIQQAKDLNYDETRNFLLTDHKLNSAALSGAENLRTAAFDGYDPRSAGVDTYSIIGCKSGTLGKFAENRVSDATTPAGNYIPSPVSGDGTVPMASAGGLPADDVHVFYAQKPVHGKMLSADGVRQKIVNIIAGASLNIGDKIISKNDLDGDPSKCQLNGRWLGIFSPVSISVTDQNGNRAGIAPDGSIENAVPGADYEVFGGHKFVFVPTDDNQTYSVNLTGSGSGFFTLRDQEINNGQAGQTAVFANIPVTAEGSGRVNLATGAAAATLSFDSAGSGNPQTILPSAVLSAEQSNDIASPVITIISPAAKDYLRSESFVIDAASADAGSGISSFDLALDGVAAASGQRVDLFFQKLGNHRLFATSTDFMDNIAVSSVNFRIIATPESTISDIERAYSLGWIAKKSVKETLSKQIKRIIRLEKRIEKIEEMDKNGKKITKLAERIEKKIDKVLAKLMQEELKLYRRQKFISDQAHELLLEDIGWLVDNRN